ncbi:MAG: ferredoxin-type protein NapF [Candidatus Electrothrix scaldis]|nr:MAG: ferredoxin-type protein NapF [Candidatus Electrothrix sp. GW3-3]
MNLTSFFVDKCLAFLLQGEGDRVQEKAVVSPVALSLPPPWSASEQEFRDLCKSCGACAAACERNLIVLEEDGLPFMDFSKGFCNFCGDCARTCPSGALHFSDEQPRRKLHVTINTHCLTRKKVLCQLCQEQCEQEAIVFLREGQGEQLPQILADQCVGCGACVAGCPVQAISLQYAENQSLPSDSTTR